MNNDALASVFDYENTVLANLAPAKLENWYRSHYFNNEIDISGSGVQDYTYKEIFDKAGIDFEYFLDRKVSDVPTLGSHSLRLLLAQTFGDGDPSKVCVTSGGNEALNLVARSIFHSSDKVVTLGPCYHCHDKIAASIGCEVVKWNLKQRADYIPDMDEFERLMKDAPKAVILNFPHNPIGVTISQDMLNDIVALVKQHEAYLIWDASFQQITYDSPPLRDPIFDYDKTISVGTFSKAYGAPGLRFGWTVSSREINEAIQRQRDYGNLYVPEIIEYIATKMLLILDQFSTPRIKQACHNRELVDQWLTENQFGLSWTKPTGGVCGLVSLGNITTDISFCEELLAKTGVLLVPGSCWDRPGTVRLGFGGPTTYLDQGLKRLQQFLPKYNDTIYKQA